MIASRAVWRNRLCEIEARKVLRMLRNLCNKQGNEQGNEQNMMIHN